MEDIDKPYLNKRSNASRNASASKQSTNNGSKKERGNRRKHKIELDVGAKWSPDEDDKLTELVNIYGDKNWGQVSKMIDNRTSVQCMNRWSGYLQPDCKKGTWSTEEDAILKQWVNYYSLSLVLAF